MHINTHNDDNEALKQAIERESLEDTLRRVMREETATYKTGARKK